MEAIELAVRLFEKVSVLIAIVLVLVLTRPAAVWLGETGSRASLRRRAFLVLVLGGLAVWGVFLGLEVGGVRFNVRMVGVIVAGFLGGTWVGVAVGVAAGVVYGLNVGGVLGAYVFGASVLVGLLSGVWTRSFGAKLRSVVAGTIAVQVAYHAVVGVVMAVADLELATAQASNLALHVVKVGVNTAGVVLFMGVLNLVGDLERAREEARRSEDEVRTARLEALQYQVKPHFLFNLLNTLAYLIRTDAVRARELTLDLAEFLRYTLAQPDARTTLRAELAQIEKYVDLERARFGDGLSVEISPVDETAGSLLVPPLILQPLVENAIRHGAQDGHVAVKLDVQQSNGAIHVRVLDDGPGLSAKGKAREGGVGLDNVRERLERFYRGAAELHLRDRDGGGACAEFSVPLSASSMAQSGTTEPALVPGTTRE